MAKRPAAEGISLQTPLGSFTLREQVNYPNGGSSLFYERGRTALIVDKNICDVIPGQPFFDYSLITNKQNEYVARYRTVYRVLAEDIGNLGLFRVDIEYQELPTPHRTVDRTNLAQASPLEMKFEEHFMNVYGGTSARYLWKEYGITDAEGHVRYIDYLVKTRRGLIGVEENGVSYHHPQVIGKRRYRTQLLKQNSCQHAGIRLFRFSSEDCRFAERLEDDIRSFFGMSTSDFMERGLEVDRPFELYEHQEGALQEMALRRAQGIRSFLAVFPTASGKSRIVEEDLARFAPTQGDFKALIAAPNTTIVDDWCKRIAASLPSFAQNILVCTYGYLTRHYTEFLPTHFSYIVIDEAHHAVAPALRQVIQYFDPIFLVGLTATDQRPDKKSLESVFGSYRVGLSLADAMQKGIVARARAFRIETNIDLGHVRINGKDYVNADLEKTVRVTSRNELIVDVLRTYFCAGETGKLQGAVFCVNVRHANEMERLLNAAGIPAKALSGQTRQPQRILQEFREGKVRFLCSCQMISEGWDYPELGVLVMARPTLSRVLYLQQLGRGLRKTPTKQDLFVIDVVDEYGSMVMPCSLHSLFQNPFYVPFGDILKHDYQPGEWVEVCGLHERIERIVEIDTESFAQKYEGYLSVEQVARDFFVSTGTMNQWIRRRRVNPTVTFRFGSKNIHLFSPADVTAARDRLGIPIHDDSTIRTDFMDFLAARDYTMSYKMPFLLAFLDHMDPLTGSANIDAVLDDYTAFYLDRIEHGLPADRGSCPYTATTLADRGFVRRSMLSNPFEKFERKRFMYYSKDLGQISLNHALLSQLTTADYEAIRSQMHTDLVEYFG